MRRIQMDRSVTKPMKVIRVTTEGGSIFGEKVKLTTELMTENGGNRSLI